MWEQLGIHPVVWKLGKNHENHLDPIQLPTMFHNMSKVCQCLKFHSTNSSHWSADLTQRSMLFICVETNSSWRLASSIAFAVSWVNSGQLFSGLCISANHYLFFFKNGMLLWPTSQLHMHLWRVFSIHDTRLINLLTSLFSICLGFLQPIFPILDIIQFGIFLWYKAIKFGEYNHQWYCEVVYELQVPSISLKCNSIINVEVSMGKKFPMLTNTIAENWSHDLPLPICLLKNLSSALAGGRELSVGMQYLWLAKPFSDVEKES